MPRSSFDIWQWHVIQVSQPYSGKLSMTAR